eukprot:612810_1
MSTRKRKLSLNDDECPGKKRKINEKIIKCNMCKQDKPELEYSKSSRRRCRKCQSQATKCKHNKDKRICRECGGSAFCPHNTIKSRCFECGGKQMCQHKRRKRQCKDCNPTDGNSLGSEWTKNMGSSISACFTKARKSNRKETITIIKQELISLSNAFGGPKSNAIQ